MPLFTYSATDKAGATVKGEREAENEKALIQILKQDGLFLLEAKEKKTGLAKFNASINVGEILSRIRPVNIVEKMFFARNLSVMIGAGLSLTRGLTALAEESTNPKFKKIILDINGGVVKGKSFAESLRIHEKVFGTLFINMVEVGETTGKLTLVLKLLANQMKKDYSIRKRVKGAMFYPAIIISALIIIGVLMMIYVVPTLSATIKELGVELPLTTKIVIGISDALVSYLIWFLAALSLAIFLFWRALKTARGKAIFDRIILKAPIFGALIKKFNVARFCRTLAYLITSGVPVVKSLEITSSVLGNTLYRAAVREAAVEIQKGKQLNQILGRNREIFQPLVTQMIQVGEETGKISDMLLRLALFFEEDVTSTTKNLSTIIEPILMIFIGAAVGFFAISMLQPIYGSLGSI